MNYFAHGFRHLGRPWFLAGTAVPDWLSVADRRVRIRAAGAQRCLGGPAPESELAAGVLRHLEDDRWFHRNPAFVEISGEITLRLRALVGRRRGARPSVFAHIATEVLLDGVLIEADSERLDAYYAELARLEPEIVQQAVNRMASGSTRRLAHFVHRFRDAEFLRDYVDDRRLLFRLNQVMCRARLAELPAEADRALGFARGLVRERLPELLPPDRDH